MTQTSTTAHEDRSRPVFPKRAVITAGMPYGNKSLHLGHIGGVFVHSDIFARFLRDRLGPENVLFVSGTDCFGSPIVEHYRTVHAAGEFAGSIEEFVRSNHENQKATLAAYHVSPDLYAASSLGRAFEIHRDLGAKVLKTLHANGHLVRLTSPQFYDSRLGTFLNGRQVIGRCPLPGCKSEKAYADECSLGHPYDPKDLIAPKSTLTGETPEMRDVSNWYIDLPRFRGRLEEWVKKLGAVPGCRPFVVASIQEFLEPPVLYVKQDQEELLTPVLSRLPAHTVREDKSKAIPLVFADLAARNVAAATLTEAGIRFRAGKTLTPFRMTGNIEWSLPAPDLEDLAGLTFWVWPESLWAPISFTSTCLEGRGGNPDAWKDWWCSKDSQVYQFIGEDNIYFYSLAEMSIFMGMQGTEPTADPPEGQLQLPFLIANNHILQFDKKASSSGKIKPIMAGDLLGHYTADQLRAHFFALGLGLRSINFRPKAFNPDADPREADPVLKEGNLLSNACNRLFRSCFYTAQKHFDGKVPEGEVEAEIRSAADQALLEFERLMSRHEFHSVMALLDTYIRDCNKYWAKSMPQGVEPDRSTIGTILVNTFHMVRTVALMLHPIAPEGTEKLRDYLQVSERFWSWEHAFQPLSFFFDDPRTHQLKFLEPRIDFFEKHPSQIEK